MYLNNIISISLCMIVKNEEDTIGRCLETVKNAIDEIIIVDTGSTDNTKNIVKKYTDKVYDFKWVDDFSAARNFAFSKATKEYIFWLDADDVFLKKDVEKFMELKKNFDKSIDSVLMNYNVGFDNYENVTLSCRRNRLVKRLKNFKWIGFVHEYLEVYGKIINSDISVSHKKIHYAPQRNLKIYEKKISEGINFTTRDILYYANELYDNKMYEKALIYYKKFLESKKGWIEDNIRSCEKVADYYLSVGNIEKCHRYLYKTFEYDTPRAEITCRIGFLFLQENKLNSAIFWYELTTKLKKPQNSLGFFYDDYWTWLPHLQLCVCYDRIGNKKLAYEHNKIAEKFRPNDPKIIYNNEYFKKIGIGV